MTVQKLKLNEMDFKDHQNTTLIKTSEACVLTIYTLYNNHENSSVIFHYSPFSCDYALLIILILHTYVYIYI